MIIRKMNIMKVVVFVVLICPAEFSTTVPKHIIELLNSDEYDRHSTPTQDKGYSTNVTISMYIEGLSSFQATTMDFHVDIYFQQWWMDPRLAHNETRRVLVRDTGILDLMWHPDLYFANARSANFHDVTAPNFLIWIFNNGTIYYDCRISLTVMCMMNLAKYPLDRQYCQLRILSYAYDIEQLDLKWAGIPKPIDINNEIKLPDMHLVYTKTGACDGTYAAGVWSCVTAEFSVRREIMHHILQSYIPTTLIVVISWFSFWLDVDAVPGRVSLCITTLLTLATQASAARLALPQVSYIKAIDVWMGTCMAFVFGVMIEFTLVNYWARRKHNKPWRPQLMQFLRRYSVFTPSNNSTAPQAVFITQPENNQLDATVESPLSPMAPKKSIWKRNGGPCASPPIIWRRRVTMGTGGERREETSLLTPQIKRTNNPFTAPCSLLTVPTSSMPTPDDGCANFEQISPTSGTPSSDVGVSTTERRNSEPTVKWRTMIQKNKILQKVLNRKTAQCIDQHCRMWFPLTFLLFNIFYWCYYIYVPD